MREKSGRMRDASGEPYLLTCPFHQDRTDNRNETTGMGSMTFSIHNEYLFNTTCAVTSTSPQINLVHSPHSPHVRTSTSMSTVSRMSVHILYMDSVVVPITYSTVLLVIVHCTIESTRINRIASVDVGHSGHFDFMCSGPSVRLHSRMRLPGIGPQF